MSRIVGIDLGTTFSALAVFDEIGKPEIVPNADGDRITPSAVYFPREEAGKTIVGAEAVKAVAFDDARVIQEIKRQMGDEHAWPVDEDKYSPTQLSSLILKKMAQDAAVQKGEISRAVITVPANFSEAARKATMDAGKLAGLDVTHIINEPTAAALFYAVNAEITGRVIVYDLGGGTFDVTVADIDGTDVRVVASLGDKFLGGKDFDRKILAAMDAAYEAKHGKKLVGSEADEAKFIGEAESLKRTLSSREKAGTVVNGPSGPFKFEMTRAEFEEAISTEIARTETMIDGVLDEASTKPGDIAHVLLVGGSTRIPVVRTKLAKAFGREPELAVNVDEAVALGAAIYAGLHATPEQLNPAQTATLKKVKLSDVCGHYYGTIAVTLNERTGREELANSIILEKNTALPCSNSEVFQTISDGQTEINCTITQSAFPESNPEFVTVISEESFDQLPAGRPAGQEIEVTFSYDENERMQCVFKDVASGKKYESTVQPQGSRDVEAEKAGVADFVVE